MAFDPTKVGKSLTKAGSVNFPVVGRIRFVTGVSLGSVRPLVGTANSVTSVADNLDNVRGSGEALRDAGAAMGG